MNYTGPVTLERRMASSVQNKFLKMDQSAFGQVIQKEEENEEEEEEEKEEEEDTENSR